MPVSQHPIHREIYSQSALKDRILLSNSLRLNRTHVHGFGARPLLSIDLSSLFFAWIIVSTQRPHNALVVSTVPLAYVRQSLTHRVGNPSLISTQRKRQITKIYDLCVDYLDRRSKSICLKDVDNNWAYIKNWLNYLNWLCSCYRIIRTVPPTLLVFNLIMSFSIKSIFL